jgi:hypothetical protein
MRIQDGERSEDINAELADRLNEMLSGQQALEEERDQVSANLVLLLLTDSISDCAGLARFKETSRATNAVPFGAST